MDFCKYFYKKDQPTSDFFRHFIVRPSVRLELPLLPHLLHNKDKDKDSYYKVYVKTNFI